jgi:5'-AMP-activated protein kinase catalytic alpha subunit
MLSNSKFLIKSVGKSYGGVKSDIWSCGIVLYAMVCGFLPFEDSNTNALYEKIKTEEFEVPAHLSH